MVECFQLRDILCYFLFGNIDLHFYAKCSLKWSYVTTGEYLPLVYDSIWLVTRAKDCSMHFFFLKTNSVGKCHEVCRRYQWHLTLWFPQRHLNLSCKMLFQIWYKNMVSLPWAWDFCCWHGTNTYLIEVAVLSFCSCSCCHLSCESFKSAIDITPV